MTEISLSDYIEELKKLDQYPLQFINKNLILKLKEWDDSIEIGYVYEIKSSLKRDLQHLHKDKKLLFYKINQSELTSYISKLTSGTNPDKYKEIVENDLNKLANDAPIINLVNSIIIDGINKEASDIHIESFESEVKLRYRIDGVLVDSESINKSNYPAISSRIKIMSNLNIMEQRLPQDGRISVILEDNKVDLRVSIVPLASGESIVLRLFVKKSKQITLEDLGYRGVYLDLMNKVIKYPHGLILVTGPTGSGKTTTLNALLQKINSSEKKIITIEDPVEYRVPGVNQIQVNNEIDLTFSSILRRVLRQDPDIIMIGEIRDKETADLVVRAALTGHLVLSTLHTNDSITTLTRLKDLGVPNYLISSVLKASIAQRLVRKICTSCLGSGCYKCSNSGYKGRIVINEGFLIDNKIENMILDNEKPGKIREYLEQKDMISLSESAKYLIQQGITDQKEISRILV